MTTEAPRTTSREEIATNVRVALARAQVDQVDVAKATNLSPSAISDRVRGLTHFRVDELQVIAHLCDVQLDELLATTAAAS